MSEKILALIKQDLMGRGLLMEVESNSTILGKFISKAIEEIYMKYSTISKGEERLVSTLIEKFEMYKVDFDPYLDYDRTKALACVLANEDNEDVIKLYVLLASNLKIRVELDEVKAFHETLESEGYVQIDKYLFFYDHGENRLKEMAEENLTEDLEDVDYALELFDSEEIAYMWIFQTSLASAAKQFIQDNGWFEALNIENLGTAFLDKFDSEIYYCLNPNEFVFR